MKKYIAGFGLVVCVIAIQMLVNTEERMWPFFGYAGGAMLFLPLLIAKKNQSQLVPATVAVGLILAVFLSIWMAVLLGVFS